MRFVIAQRRLDLPGGSETFVLTCAEHLALLGHEVVVWAMELGLAAQFGRQQGLEIIDRHDALPTDADATIALDRSMAIELARRYPQAKRVYAMHNMDEVWLPPPEPGIVAATIAPNERLAKLAAGCAGAGNIIRIKQPIDLYRFTPRGCWARDKPTRVLLLGNYREVAGQRVDRLRQAWSHLELEWYQVGYPNPTMAVAKGIWEADIIVGYGRTILEAMACGRPAYVHEHSGSDGWVTADSYAQLEADGFAGTALRPTPTIEQLREDFLRYDPALGRVGQDFARAHHDARQVIAGLVAAVDRLAPPSQQHDPAALRALRNLAESRIRADFSIDEYRSEVRVQTKRLRAEQEQVVALHNEMHRLREELRAQQEQTCKLRTRLDEITRSRRFAFMRTLFRPIDWCRTRLKYARRMSRSNPG
jgi:hypothetical protein